MFLKLLLAHLPYEKKMRKPTDIFFRAIMIFQENHNL